MVIDIFKTPQYLARWGYPKHYHYRYYTPKKHNVASYYEGMGKEVKGFKTTKQAFHMVMRKGGYARNVFSLKLPIVYKNEDNPDEPYREIIKDEDGNIKFMRIGLDIHYGNKNIGLRHILLRHYVRNADFKSPTHVINSIYKTLVEINKRGGKLLHKPDANSGKFVFVDSRGYKIVFAQIRKEDDERREMVGSFVLTSYDCTRKESEKERTPEEQAKRLREIDELLEQK